MIGSPLLYPRLIIAVNILLSLCLLAEAKFQDFPGYDQMSNCAEFTCPNDDETAVPKSPLDYLSSTGCMGIGGGGISMLAGGTDSEGMNVLEPCCDLFHACLQICGTKKQFCINNASKCMENKCDSIVNLDVKKECRKEYETKKIMYNFSGCHDFDLAQKKNCDCVKTDSVGKKRDSVVRSFYAKHNPDNMGKVNSLIAKATDKNKLAGLLYKLIARYPKAINASKNNRQQKLEEALKRMRMDSDGYPMGDKPQKVDVKDDNDDDERIEL